MLFYLADLLKDKDLTVIVEDVRPVLHPGRALNTELLDSVRLAGFCQHLFLFHGVPVILRHPTQMRTAYQLIKKGYIGFNPRPRAEHFLDAEAHAIAWLIENDEDVANKVKEALNAELAL